MALSEYQKMFEAETSYFWFVAKQKLVSRIVGGLSLPREAQILDLGCGTGINLKNLRGYGDCVGADYSPEAFAYCLRRSCDQLVSSRAEVLPFKPGSFDLVTSLDTIEHTEDPAGMVREVYAALKPGGYLLLTAPAYPGLFGAHDYALGHKTRYTRDQVLSLLSKSGFRIEVAGHYFGLVFPAAAALKLYQRRFGSRTETVSYHLPFPLNSIFLALCEIEAALFPHFQLPFGTTLVALCRKPA